LTATKRVDFASDPRTAGRRRAGQRAGDGDAAWLLSASAHRCVYGTAQITVKTRYRLWVIPAVRTMRYRYLADTLTCTYS
jgi:hypothetical protein